MSLDEQQFISLLVKSLLWEFFQWIILQWLRVERLMWIRFSRTLLRIWGLVYRLNELVKKETGQPVETTDADPQERNIVCRPPIQETQKPGIHPSNVFSDAIRRLGKTLKVLDQKIMSEQRAISRDQPNQDESQQGGDYCEEQGEQGVRDETPKEAEGEDPIQVLGHDVEGKEVNQEGDKKNASPEAEEPQGAKASLGIAKYVPQKAKDSAPKPPKAESTIPEERNVPGDVDRSINQPAPVQPEASAEVQNSSSDEGPSATGNTANKKRKKRRQRKKAEVAVSRDPQTSTDESHHSSIEVFSSGNEEPAGSRDQETCKGK